TGLTPASDDKLTTAWSTIHMINHLSTGRTVAPRRGVHQDRGQDPLLMGERYIHHEASGRIIAITSAVVS
ncbi:MAG: hypothetical protein LC808_28855, partial [Actinobacteria bacterium]|nr:hypothetical protein [Actinomycetota bacterium]